MATSWRQTPSLSVGLEVWRDMRTQTLQRPDLGHGLEHEKHNGVVWRSEGVEGGTEIGVEGQ